MTQPMPAQDILANTKIWFTRVRPEPNDQHFHSQLGCHFEEVAEMIEELDVKDPETGAIVDAAFNAVHALAEYLKTNSANSVVKVPYSSRVRFLDSICDQIVTGVGVAHTLHMDPLNGMMEVNKSNYSKFGNDGRPIYDANMKMTKGPDYVEAILIAYV
jgi:hypothetical protein